MSTDEVQLEFEWVVEPYDSAHEAPKGDPVCDCKGESEDVDTGG